MKILFTPVRTEDRLEATVVDADNIVLNGEGFDFSPLLEGETIDASHVGSKWVAGTVKRSGGELYITLVLPHGHDAPHSTRFPSSEYLTISEGIVPVPEHGGGEDGVAPAQPDGGAV